jgi:hypothetical protein
MSGPNDVQMPMLAEDIAPAWLTTALRAGGLPGARVRDVRRDILGADRGLGGVTLRLHLQGSADVPATLVPKLPHADEGARERVRPLGFYACEVGFYRELADRVPLRVPKAYYGAYEEATNSFVLLLEDIGWMRMPDDGEATVDEVALALETIAPMHAAYWVRPPDFPWLQTGSGTMFIAEKVRGLFHIFEERMASPIDPLIASILQRHPDAFLAGRLESDWPRTLCHGDYSCKNVAFAPGEVCPFDWQLAIPRAISRDVMNMAIRSLPPAVAVAECLALIEHYRAALARPRHGAALLALGPPALPRPPDAALDGPFVGPGRRIQACRSCFGQSGLSEVGSSARVHILRVRAACNEPGSARRDQHGQGRGRRPSCRRDLGDRVPARSRGSHAVRPHLG